VRMRTSEEKWRRKGSPPHVTSNLDKSNELEHCLVKNAAVLCESHCERVTQI